MSQNFFYTFFCGKKYFSQNKSMKILIKFFEIFLKKFHVVFRVDSSCKKLHDFLKKMFFFKLKKNTTIKMLM